MRRWFALAVAVLLTVVAVVAWRSGRAVAEMPPPPAPVAAATFEVAPRPAPTLAPQAAEPTQRSREERRFARYDKDKDAGVSRDEYFATRRRNFAKLDGDGDGRLSFDEYAVKAVAKFEDADRDRSGALDAPEFATTAATRRAQRRDCPPAPASDADA